MTRVYSSKDAGLTAERLREVLDYDPETGAFTWKVMLAYRAKVGAVAGWSGDDGRITITINNTYYKAHRLAWLYMTGRWPEQDIDHRDLDASNNRWNNLREATPAQNLWNTGAHRNNKTGYKGVFLVVSSGRYRAAIRVAGKTLHLGCFMSAEMAHAAYAAAAREHRGEFARVS